MNIKNKFKNSIFIASNANKTMGDKGNDANGNPWPCKKYVRSETDEHHVDRKLVTQGHATPQAPWSPTATL